MSGPRIEMCNPKTNSKIIFGYSSEEDLALDLKRLKHHFDDQNQKRIDDWIRERETR